MQLKRILIALSLMYFTSSASFAQSTFVEYHKEVTSFDNTECVQKDFDISFPIFDFDSISVIEMLNDTLNKIAGVILEDINRSMMQQSGKWKEKRLSINQCEDGVATQETRELTYSILLNTEKALSLFLRHRWVIEKFEQGAAMPDIAEQEKAYCFTLDIEKRQFPGINDIIIRDSITSFIQHIREAYETEFDELMDKAGDRIVFSGLLFNKINLIAVYERRLPGNQSEIRIVELPLNEVADLMQLPYRKLLQPVNE